MYHFFYLILVCNFFLERERESNFLVNYGFVWLEERKNGRKKNYKRIENWKDRKVLIFLYVCVVGGWKTLLFGWRETWEDEKCNLYELTIM